MEQLDDATRVERETIIAEEYGGIYPVYEAFYIHSIIYAADRADDAFRRFDEAVGGQSTAARIVATVQEGLTHAGALSRFFWPMKKTKLTLARANNLRTAFQLYNNSPLRLRSLRNSFEHFDEDLDRFLLTGPVGYFFPGPMVDDHVLADEAVGNIFKLIDPKANICVLLGQKFKFAPIRQEVERILSCAIEMDRNGSRLSSRRPS